MKHTKTNVDEEIPIEEVATEADRKLLKEHGFTKALLRLDSEDDEEDEEEESERTTRCPSQRGMGAVVNEYKRMGMDFEE